MVAGGFGGRHFAMQTINSAQRGTIAAQGEAAAANERLTAQLLAAKDEVAAAKDEVAAAKGETATKTAHLYEQLLAAEGETATKTAHLYEQLLAAEGETATKTAHLYEQLLVAKGEKHKLAMDLRNIHPRLDRLAVRFVLGAPVFLLFLLPRVTAALLVDGVRSA